MLGCMTLTFHSTHELDFGFQGQIKKRVLGMGGPTDVERKGCEYIWCWTHYVTSFFTSPMTLNFDFQSEMFKKPYFGNGRAIESDTIVDPPWNQ